MTALLAGIYAFVLENWLGFAVGAALLGGWLFICRELCICAEPEDEDGAPRPVWTRRTMPRAPLSSCQASQHVRPHASFRNRRS